MAGGANASRIGRYKVRLCLASVETRTKLEGQDVQIKAQAAEPWLKSFVFLFTAVLRFRTCHHDIESRAKGIVLQLQSSTAQQDR